MKNQKCKCQTCGKTWKKGEQGDNEKFCIRCCRIANRELIEEFGYDQDDMCVVSEPAYPASNDIWDDSY